MRLFICKTSVLYTVSREGGNAKIAGKIFLKLGSFRLLCFYLIPLRQIFLNKLICKFILLLNATSAHQTSLFRSFISNDSRSSCCVSRLESVSDSFEKFFISALHSWQQLKDCTRRCQLPLPTPLKTLLMNLAFSDLGVGLLAQPMYVASLFLKAMKLNTDNYLFNIVSVVVVNILSFASFFLVTAVSADRFLAIHLHLRYQELVTLKRVVSAVISIWVFSAIFSLLFSFIPEMAFLAKVSITACFISTTFFYVKIYVAVRRHTSQIQALQVNELSQNGETASALRLRKSAVSTFYVYVVFVACYLPKTCILLAGSRALQSTWIKHLNVYTFTLLLVNSSLNPVIYCWKMRHIRHTVFELLRNIYSKVCNYNSNNNISVVGALEQFPETLISL